MSESFRIGPFRLAPHQRNGKPTGRWLVDVPASIAGGKRRRKFFDTCTDAKRFARELERRYRRGELVAAAPSEPQAPADTFQKVADDWLAFQDLRVATGKKRQSSLDADCYRLRLLLSLFADDDPSDITEERIVEFQAMRLRQGRSPSTVNSDVRLLLKLLRWAHRKGRLPALPEFEWLPEHVSDAVVPTEDEVRRIIDHLPKRLKPLVRLIAQTGCRSGEAFHLTWENVDFDNCMVAFRPHGDWTPKTRSSVRQVPISRELADELKRLPREGAFVFPGKSPGKPIREIKRAFQTAVEAAGIRRNGKPVRITPHTLRKATATWLAVDHGVPQRVLQSILGHAPGSTVTNRYYVSSSDDAKRRAVAGLSI
jgi:integrase